MKQFLTLLILILLFYCKEMNKSDQAVNKTIQKSAQLNLLSKFKKIDIDTLEIYSTPDFGIYKGHQIDSSDAILFPKEIAEAYLLDHDIYACYRFNIDSSKIGLIVRTPSMYVSSSIKLFVYNKTSDRISHYIELAESWGDAGDAIEKTSWIIKNKKNHFSILTREIESHDHRADDENDTIVDKWDRYSLLALNDKIDTVSNNSVELKKKYNLILTKDFHH